MQLLISAPQMMISSQTGLLPRKSLLIRLLSIFFLCKLQPILYAAGSVPEEGQALLEIKRSLKDSNNELYTWDGTSDQDHCYWRGVFCDNATLSVVQLSISGLNLSGEISPSIGQLKKLQLLNMSHNSISGQIPDEIGGCSNLDTIDLSFNQIKGDIPFSLSKLKELETFIMKSNQLSGPIPSTLSQLPNLKTIDLAENYLTGEIPSLIYWSEVLQYLGLRNNFISGTLSEDIWRMTALWYFDVRNNNITGEIPESIANCTSFEILDLSFNELTGSIPYSIGFLQVATLSLQGNRLTGKIPDVVGLMQALAVLDLSYNQLEGPIPAILGNLSFTGKLYLQGNKLSGSIPHELGNMTKLQYLQVNNNQLSGQIPPELGKLEELFELNLANNYFEGPIPKELSYCVSLTYFNTHGNQLTGAIPPEFQNIVSLTDLNLSSNHLHGSIPPELGHFRNLDTLDLSDNLLTGSIPNSLGDLEHLITLDLSKNKLSGPIPTEFGNMKYIEKIDMSFNNLSGSIPQELGQLEDLDILYLNNNNFTGEIPQELSNCLSLVALNLSYNHLTGEIPEIKNFSRFAAESYIANKGLCGKQLGLVCGHSKEPSRGLQSRNLFIGLGISGTVFAVVLLAWIWKSNITSGVSGMKNSLKSTQGSPRIVILHMDLAGHTFDDIMRLTEDLGERYVIGFGASSTVYKCTLKSGKPVAVKKLYTQCQQNVREFEVELATVGRIKHRNLVSLLGYSLSPHGNLLFYDYMENGSLWDVLHGERKMKLDWDLRLNIAIGAARGLAYLHHDCNPRIVHRDIKTSNILLDESYEAHLTDFGIAKNISLAKAHTSTLVVGTIGYIDPEYARTSRINEKSDVYSFGIVLLELLTGKKAVDNETNLHQWVINKRENGSLVETLDPVLKDTGSDLAAVNKALQLGLLCTSKQPSARPTMNDVVRVLASLFPVTTVTKHRNLTPSLDFDYPRYLDEYGNSKSKDKLPESSNTSTGNLFVQFEEVISSNRV